MKHKDFEKFFENKVVKCSSESTAKIFIKLAHMRGYTWNGLPNCYGVTWWFIYGDNTCYIFDRHKEIKFCKTSDDVAKGYEVLDFNEWFNKNKRYVLSEIKKLKRSDTNETSGM